MTTAFAHQLIPVQRQLFAQLHEIFIDFFQCFEIILGEAAFPGAGRAPVWIGGCSSFLHLASLFPLLITLLLILSKSLERGNHPFHEWGRFLCLAIPSG